MAERWLNNDKPTKRRPEPSGSTFVPWNLQRHPPKATEAPPPPATPITEAPPPAGTPTVKKTAIQVAFLPDAPSDMDDMHKRLAADTKGHYFVGIKPDAFLKEFLPWNPTTKPVYRNQDPGRVREANLRDVPRFPGKPIEDRMYPKYVTALDGWVIGTGPNPSEFQKLTFLDSGKSLPDVECNRLHMDVSSCKFSLQQTQEEFKTDIRYDAFWHKFDESPTYAPLPSEEASHEDGFSEKAVEHWEKDEDETHEILDKDGDGQGEDTPAGEPEESPNEDAPGQGTKTDKEKPVIGENDTQNGSSTRGQITAYAGVALSMAFRSHIFSLLILGQYARFIRWDRRGAVVSRRFDYLRRPDLIFKICLRYGQLSPQQRGFDPTVTECKAPLPESVIDAFNKYHQEVWAGGAKFKHFAAKDLVGQPILPAKNEFYRVEVTDATLNCTESFIVPGPKFHPRHYHPFCRASRRSLACPLPKNDEKPEMCFIKDSWQEASQRTAPEAEIYRMLKAHNVQYVASMRLGGDVAGLVTETQNWFNILTHRGHFTWLGTMVCHRIVLDTVARDLSTFCWAKVLVSCVADAVQAAQQAYKAGIMHRDISADNIMIVRDKVTQEWRGVLIDWDMCLLWRTYQGRERSGRTGTWAFLSAKLLTSPPPVAHTLSDDMESAVWVIIYEALRFLARDLNPVMLDTRFTNLFSQEGSGDVKVTSLVSCPFLGSRKVFAAFKAPGFNQMLNELAKVFAPRYYEDKSEQGPVNLDDPDDTWLPNFLRETALTLMPLNITPTALKSPTQDSRPPVDRKLWKSASPSSDSPSEFVENAIESPDHSERVKARKFITFSSALFNYMDGYSASSSNRFASIPNKREINETEEDSKIQDKGHPQNPKKTRLA